MNKVIVATLTTLALIAYNNLFAQDTITLKTGEKISAKVEEVGLDIVTYKKSDNLDGPSYLIRKADVVVISYSNNTKDFLNVEKKEVKDTAQNTQTLKTDSEIQVKEATPKWKRAVGYAGGSLGAPYPVGEFNKVADAGFQLNYFAGYLFSENIGVFGKVSFSIIPFSEGSDFWLGMSFCAGPILSIPYGHRLNLDLRPMIGWASYTYPYVYYADDEINSDRLGLTLGFGGTLRIRLSKFFSIMVLIDYQHFESNKKLQGKYPKNVNTISPSFGAAFTIPSKR